MGVREYGDEMISYYIIDGEIVCMVAKNVFLNAI